MIIVQWFFTALLIFPSGEVDRRQALFETVGDCEGERQRVWLHMIQIDPLIKVESSCRPFFKTEEGAK